MLTAIKKRKCLIIAGSSVIFFICFVWICIDNNEWHKNMTQINVYVPMSSSEASWNRVSEAMSKITKKELGCTVKLYGIELDNYYDSVMQNYLNGKQVDICAIFGQDSFLSMVNNECLRELDEDIKPYASSLLDILSPNAWQSSFVKEHQYAIPSNQKESQAIGFLMRRDICDALNILPEEIKNFDDIHEILLKVKDAYPDIAPLGAHYGQTLPFLGVDMLGNGLGVIMDFESAHPEIVNLYESELYYNYCDMMHQWYEEGLILENCYNSAMSYNQLMNENEIFACFNTSGQGVTNVNMLKNDLFLIEILLGNALVSTDSTNLYWAITNNCENPGLAMEFLYMMYTNEEIIKLYTWGVEGIDYEIQPSGDIVWADTDYSNQWQTISWSWPNAKKLEPFYKKKMIESYSEDVVQIVSVACGFIFDSEPVSNEVAMCQSVVEKYNNVLLSGYLDPAQGIADFNQELKRAGIDLVIQEKIRQFQQWQLR